jgi:hypothetical protein
MSAENPMFVGLHCWTSTLTTKRLEPGMLIAWENQPYRVIEIAERALVDWDDRFHEPWEKSGRPDPATWQYRPYALVIQHDRETGAEPRHRISRADRTWTVLPEHYSVCARCGEIPPCRENLIVNEMATASKRMDWAMGILPHCCHGCGEPITTRQKCYRFVGPNLIRPDLPDDSAVFHARRACLDAAFRYDERWAAAAPGRRRRFFCEGTETLHRDGTRECTEGDLCPGAPAHHKGFTRHSTPWTAPGACWCLADGTAGQLATAGHNENGTAP